MIGSEGVTRGLLSLMKTNMPAKLGELRARLSAVFDEDEFKPTDIPEVQKWYSNDIDELEVGGFPAILVVEVESTGRIANQTQEISFTYDEYTFEYVMRIYVWAMGDSAGGTSLLAKRFVQAIEEIALGRKVVFRNADEQAGVDPTSIRHSYSDAAIDDARQVLQGAYVEVRVRTIERVQTLVMPYVLDEDGEVTVPPIETSVTLGYNLDLETGLP